MILGIFEEIINKGVSQLDSISDPAEKGKLCAELAKAIAMSGLLTGKVSSATEPVKKVEEQKIETTTKKDLEKEAAKAPAKPKAPAKKEAAKAPAKKEEKKTEPIAPAPPVEEEVNEWNDETQAKYAEQLGLISQAVEAFGEDTINNDAVSAFSEGQFTGLENITPANIEAFAIFLTTTLS